MLIIVLLARSGRRLERNLVVKNGVRGLSGRGHHAMRVWGYLADPPRVSPGLDRWTIFDFSCQARSIRGNVFGKSFTKSKSFTDWIYNEFKNNKKFYLFNDVNFNPLRIKSLVKIISIIINRGLYINYGIYNLGSKDAIYKNQFAILFAKKVGIYKKNYSNISVNKILKVKRSTNMFMNVNKFERIFKLDLPSMKSEIINEAKEYIK